MNSTNDSLDPFDSYLAKKGGGVFETMKCNQVHGLYLTEEAVADDKEEVIGRPRRELDGWVEEQRN